MIELCSKKKMVFAIALLIIVSVVVLVIENNMPLGHEMKDSTLATGNQSEDCWRSAETSIEEECAPCTSFEKKAHSYCESTGYRELVKCTFTNGAEQTVFRSCPKVSWMEERQFWLFEAVTAVVGAAACANVVLRQKRLDRMLMEKVHRQIAAGV